MLSSGGFQKILPSSSRNAYTRGNRQPGWSAAKSGLLVAHEKPGLRYALSRLRFAARSAVA
jgi:hypothetical protein